MTWPNVPERVRMRNAKVVSVTNNKATLTMDGNTVASVPIYGPTPANNSYVLVLEQGHTFLVLGNAVSLVARIVALEARLSVLEGGDNGNH